MVDYPAFVRPMNVCVRCFIMDKACHGYNTACSNGLEGVCGQCQYDRKTNNCHSADAYFANKNVSTWHRVYMAGCGGLDLVGPAMAMPALGFNPVGKPFSPVVSGSSEVDELEETVNGRGLLYPFVVP